MTTATATPTLTLAEQAAAAEHKRIVNSLEVYRKLAQAAAAGEAALWAAYDAISAPTLVLRGQQRRACRIFSRFCCARAGLSAPF